MKTRNALKGAFALLILWVVILIFSTSSTIKHTIGLAMICGWMAIMFARWTHGKYEMDNGRVEDLILLFIDKNDPLWERIMESILFVLMILLAASSVILTILGLFILVDDSPNVGIAILAILASIVTLLILLILVFMISIGVRIFKEKKADIYFPSNVPNTPESVPTNTGPSIRWFKGEVRGNSVVVSFHSENGKEEITLPQSYMEFWSRYRDPFVEQTHCMSGFGGVINGNIEEQFDQQAEEGRKYDFFVPNDPMVEATLKDVPLYKLPIDGRKWVERVRQMGILDEVTVLSLS